MRPKSNRALVLLAAIAIITGASSRVRGDGVTGTCATQMITIPFTDVSSGSVFFCSIAEAYFSGLSSGTTPSTYNPGDPVLREQMAAFTTRTLDQSVKRSSRRAALNQYWTTQGANNLALTTVGPQPQLVQSDGADLWAADIGLGTVSRVRASDGKLLGTWTGPPFDFSTVGVLCAMGKVFVTSGSSPGYLYQLDPTQPPGTLTTLCDTLADPYGIGYDGQRIWIANGFGFVSMITLNPTVVTNVSTGFTSPGGVIYDGTNIWVTDDVSGTVDKLRKLDSSGAILLSVDVGSHPVYPGFDGTNIWVPNFYSNTVSVVRGTGTLAGTVLATLSGNGLDGPATAAFDGERILVTNYFGGSVSLWKASDFTPIGTFDVGTNTQPVGACSDGLNFWITLSNTGKLARFRTKMARTETLARWNVVTFCWSSCVV
jgi:hypothetical protein